MSEPYDHSVRNGRLQGHRTILVAEPNVVTERLAHRLCLFDTNDPACTPIYYFQIVVYCCKVAPQRKVALAEINVATYRLNDSTANVATIFKTAISDWGAIPFPTLITLPIEPFLANASRLGVYAASRGVR